MNYQIKLRIGYKYDSPAARARHVVCVRPLAIDGYQEVISSLLNFAPEPVERWDRSDFFGNAVTEFRLAEPHVGLMLDLQAEVRRIAPLHKLDRAVAVADLPSALAQTRDMTGLSPHHFLAPSHHVPIAKELTEFAQAQLRAGQSLADLTIALGQALHGHMRFDAKATTVETPATEAFAKQHGVCQDFSHIMIACLRGIGVPAGYVCGFLRTLPPPGKPRLEGADAMHAWVMVWCGPQTGWIEFDPTNNKLSDADYVTVGRGRDYADVAPIKGALRISGTQKSTQSVDMIPLD